MDLPGISILIPTLNAQRYLAQCLQSIRDQDYPSALLEIIVADAGSTDSTLELLLEFGIDRTIPNPGVTGEAARALLIREATRELILSVDADNYLVGADWLRRMVVPLQQDATIFAVEPLRWHYTRADPPINRYFSLSGINDPVSLFQGNYGRYSYLTGKWTEMPHTEEIRDGYFVAGLQQGRVPTMGANGFLVRSDVLRSIKEREYYFDIDVVNELVANGHCRVAKVDVALGHHFARDLATFGRKTRRRIEDYLYWRHARSYPWLSARGGLIRFVVETVLVFPMLVVALRGWWKVHDPAWLYHVPVCGLTLWVYSRAVLTSRVRRAPYSRRGWQH
jgi:glycosyltransferase involved in cell wall biosynthesis